MGLGPLCLARRYRACARYFSSPNKLTACKSERCCGEAARWDQRFASERGVKIVRKCS